MKTCPERQLLIGLPTLLILLALAMLPGCGGDDDDDAADTDTGDDDGADDDTGGDDDLSDDDLDDDATDDDTGDDDTDDDVDDDTGDDDVDDDTADDDIDDDDTGDDDTEPECGDLLTPDTTEPEMVEIPAGTFTQGSPDEELGHTVLEKQREVTITKNFLMMKYEVTQALWLGVNGSINPNQWECGEDLPVAVVSWMNAVAYANKMSELWGYDSCYTIDGSDVTWDHDCDGFRLPTEAEWEYAARGGTTTSYYNGEIEEIGCTDTGLMEIAWYCASGYHAGPVGQKIPNNYGLYDMLGNAWEWTYDGYNDDYYFYDPDGPVTDPVAEGTLARIYRGGSMFASASDCRAGYRRLALPTYLDEDNGVRFVRNVPVTR